MKTLRIATALLLTSALMLTTLVSCTSSSSNSEQSSSQQAPEISHSTDSTEEMSQEDPTGEQLVELAQAEGSLMIYSASSRHSKAAEIFAEKYGIKVESTQLSDGEMIEKVSKEAAAGLYGADVVFAQDSGRVYGELITPGYVYNYVPVSLRDSLADIDQNPLVFQFCNKVFAFNNENSTDTPITNIWQMTEPDWKGRVQMKDPFQEGVNMNFLTMLTNPEISNALAEAYKDMYGTDLELTTENAGYEWIKLFFNNGVVLGTSDTTISEAVGAKGQNQQLMGLFTYNKTRMAGEKDLALDVIMDLKPIAGFYYPMYALVPNNSAHPNAAKLFIEFCLNEEGYDPWLASPGDYSPNPAVPIAEGDRPISEWDNILIREDPEWVFQNRAKVEDFLSSIIA